MKARDRVADVFNEDELRLVKLALYLPDAAKEALKFAHDEVRLGTIVGTLITDFMGKEYAAALMLSIGPKEVVAEIQKTATVGDELGTVENVFGVCMALITMYREKQQSETSRIALDKAAQLVRKKFAPKQPKIRYKNMDD